MANKKITDATTATSVAGTDKVFLNQGGDLKQVDLNSAVANSQAVQTLNSKLAKNSINIKYTDGVSKQAGVACVINGVLYISFCLKITKNFSAGDVLFTVTCNGKTLSNTSSFGYGIGRANNTIAVFVFQKGDVCCRDSLVYTKDCFPVFTIVAPYAFT